MRMAQQQQQQQRRHRKKIICIFGRYICLILSLLPSCFTSACDHIQHAIFVSNMRISCFGSVAKIWIFFVCRCSFFLCTLALCCSNSRISCVCVLLYAKIVMRRTPLTKNWMNNTIKRIEQALRENSGRLDKAERKTDFFCCALSSLHKNDSRCSHESISSRPLLNNI